VYRRILSLSLFFTIGQRRSIDGNDRLGGKEGIRRESQTHAQGVLEGVLRVLG
jgi:hypothetical protein